MEGAKEDLWHGLGTGSLKGDPRGREDGEKQAGGRDVVGIGAKPLVPMGVGRAFSCVAARHMENGVDRGK